jgi:hypothetical protein
MITGWWQTDPRLALNEREYSCAVLDSLYLMPDDYTPDDVNRIVLKAILGKLLDAECSILSWALWLGSLHSSETVEPYPLQFSRKAGADYRCGPDEKELLKGSLSNIGGFHFVVGNGKPFMDVSTNVVWDSMNRPDIMRAFWTFAEKVIVKVG